MSLFDVFVIVFQVFRSHLTSKKPKDGVFVVKKFSKLLILGLISKRLRKKIEKKLG